MTYTGDPGSGYRVVDVEIEPFEILRFLRASLGDNNREQSRSLAAQGNSSKAVVVSWEPWRRQLGRKQTVGLRAPRMAKRTVDHSLRAADVLP
jgi:hypothetical protein